MFWQVFWQVNTRSLRATRPLICPFTPKAGANGDPKTRDSLTPFEMTLCKWLEYTEKFKLYHYLSSEPVMLARLSLAEDQWMVGDKHPSREMKKQRRGKTNGIHAVQDSAVPFNGAAKILHAAVPLDGRHR